MEAVAWYDKRQLKLSLPVHRHILVFYQKRICLAELFIPKFETGYYLCATENLPGSRW